ncbi:class I SAM-dependent methyltransferase [Candidatus Oscillochloris fontis]|uniref:class I SAM-dependent methyltransferase n=1 Tax=Candidatus Oscillochloris fontis TaxID=2496868 RepID=UPI00101CCEDC|nr:class I SAM-dependent methyltransferase [Candidatus Oscillochloris fontis]
MAELNLLAPPPWQEYELIDSGNGAKLERFGQYTLVRPETQAIWSPNLSEREWQRADVVFEKLRGEDGVGLWHQRRPIPEQWLLHHDNLAFWARLTPYRHTGVFPEHSAHWAWMRRQLATRRQPRVLVLFGYTGLSSLEATRVGAQVVHVDASKPALRWAQENQQASELSDRPLRWLLDDVGKFVAREIRRDRRYDLILMDPPIFGRGPNGELWRLNEQLPALVRECVKLLSDTPLGILISAYATNISALTLQNVLDAALTHLQGTTSAGELVLRESASNRLLPAAIYACWSSGGHPHQAQQHAAP